mgnify:CR=1 FL=1
MQSSRLSHDLKLWAPYVMEISMLGYLFLIPLEHASLGKNLFLGSGILAWGLEHYFFKKDGLSGHRILDKYILIYIVAILISAYFSKDLLISTRALRGDISKLLLVYILAVRVYREPAPIRRLFYTLVAFSAIVTVYSITGYLLHWPSVVMPEGQVKGPFGYFNACGHYLAYHFLIALAFFIREEHNKLKYLWSVILSLQLVLILLSQSRTALVAVIIGAVSLLLLQPHNRKTLATLSLIILITLGLGFSNGTLFNRFLTILDPATYKEVSNRTVIWRDTIKWSQDRPWIGNGYGGDLFSKTAQFYSKPKNYVHAHNTFLEILFESGIIGLSTYLILFFRAAWYSYRLRSRTAIHPLLLSLFILIFFLSLTETIFLTGRFGVFLWVLFALVAQKHTD